MAEFAYIFKTFIEKGSLSGSRSTVLQPFYWIIGILIIGLSASFQFDAPQWSMILLTVGLALSILSFLGAYFYCLIYDRNALRSEKYNLNKMAMEKGIQGNDLSGLLDSAFEEESSTELTEEFEKIESK